MSVSRLTTTALQRDYSPPTSPDARPASKEDLQKVTPQTALETLASLIPTEPLALYTALIALFLAEIGEEEPVDQYLPQRWIILGVFAAFIPVYLLVRYLQNRRIPSGASRKAPWAEMFGATVAFGAWSLVMPGSPLAAILDGSAERITLGVISIGAVAALTLTGIRLSKPAKVVAA